MPQFASNLLIDSTALFGGALALATMGIFIWWLIRKRLVRLWLPTIRVIDLESRRLPKMRMKVPPLIPFLAFLIASAAIVFYMLKPREQVFTPYEPNKSRIHIFLDLSPSVAASNDTSDINETVLALYKSLVGNSKVTLGTSHANTIFEPRNSDELMTILGGLGFHRAGVRLGNALKLQLKLVGEIDRLFIMSDQDQHSWSDLNWRFLSDEMEVLRVNVAKGSNGDRGNVFIDEADFLSVPSSTNMEWDIELARTDTQKPQSGRLKVAFNEKVLTVGQWFFAIGQSRATVRMTWPQSTVKSKTESDEDAYLQWSIEGMEDDSLSLDNSFITSMLGMQRGAIIISEPSGEQLLDDPMHQLQVALQVLGIQSKRFDQVPKLSAEDQEIPFWILMGGTGNDISHFCPETLAANGKPNQQKGVKRVWLVPYDLKANYSELCNCYGQLIGIDGGQNGEWEFCRNLTTRDEWVGVLGSLGAKMVGGEVDNSAGAVAWLGKGQKDKKEVLAFTVPLKPSLVTGINHASFPIMVKELLSWQGILQRAGRPQNQSWPRIADLSEVVWTTDGPTTPEDMRKNRLTNVPIGESILASLNASDLPPQWSPTMTDEAKDISARKDREDPLPWLKLCAAAIIFAGLMEGIWLLAKNLLRLLRRRGAAALILLLGIGYGVDASSQIELITAGTGYQKTRFNTFATEVSRRTSIEIQDMSKWYPQSEKRIWQESWLWITDLELVRGKGKSLSRDAILWLKKGGFLVLEGVRDATALQSLTAEAFSHEPNAPEWKAIPPDHELMRSFYLLDALPTCQSSPWQGLQHDGRLMILAIPHRYLNSLKDDSPDSPCGDGADREKSYRIFVNLLMVALTTDYKKDQIHLPEILKRLR